MLDEMTGGFAVASAPALRHDTASGLVGLSTALLTAPMLSSFLDAPILAWTDRAKAQRHRVVAAGVAGMALALALTSFAHGAIALGFAMALYGAASGVALGTAEAMLVDGAGEDTARRLARWSLFASMGDVLAPASLWVAAACGVGWRASFRGAAVALVLAAVVVATARDEDAAPTDDDDESHEPVWRALRATLRHHELQAWLLGASLCALLDELLAVFAALWLAARFSPWIAAPALVLFSTGSTLGAALLERSLARRPTAHLLAASSAVGAAAYVAWLLAPTWPLALALFFVVGVAVAPLHPLAKAEAFASLPDRPGLVNGVAEVFVFVDLLAPIALASVATRYGLRTALAVLVLQPLALLALALRAMRRRRARTQ